MANPDLQEEGEGGGGGSGHPDPEISGEESVSQKNFFGPSGLSLV